MENHETQNQDAQATRAEAHSASTESHRISFAITEELFASLSQRYSVETDRELAEAFRLGLYKQAGIARPATKQEIRAELKKQARIAKLKAEIAALEAE